jgi:hypothetical protein
MTNTLFTNEVRTANTDTLPGNMLMTEYHTLLNAELAANGHDGVQHGTAASFAFKGYTVGHAAYRVISLRG